MPLFSLCISSVLKYLICFKFFKNISSNMLLLHLHTTDASTGIAFFHPLFCVREPTTQTSHLQTRRKKVQVRNGVLHSGDLKYTLYRPTDNIKAQRAVSKTFAVSDRCSLSLLLTDSGCSITFLTYVCLMLSYQLNSYMCTIKYSIYSIEMLKYLDSVPQNKPLLSVMLGRRLI